MTHPAANDLALFAGGETGRLRHFFLERHVRACADCQGTINEYQQLRDELTHIELPDLNWNSLAAEMRANIRLGLEAGACVRTSRFPNGWNPRLTIAFASLLLLVASSFFLRDGIPRVAESPIPVLRSSGAGIELRTGPNSLTLLNHHGAVTDQTVSA